MRLFVAVELGSDEGGRLSAPEHLTLRFLGEVPEEAVARIEELLGPVGSAHAPFEIVLEGVGAFPSPQNPRVVWQGVTVGRAGLEQLARGVRGALAADFGDEAGPFVPHHTLFRVRSATDRRAARELIEGVRPPPPPRRVWVREFVLKVSTLGARGAVHQTLAAFPLVGRAPERP